jgi:hypothetical protein
VRGTDGKAVGCAANRPLALPNAQAVFVSGPLGLRTSGRLRDAPISLAFTAGGAAASAAGPVAGRTVSLAASYPLVGAIGDAPHRATLSFKKSKQTFKLDLSKAKRASTFALDGNLAGTAIGGWATGLQMGVLFNFEVTATLADVRELP